MGKHFDKDFKLQAARLVVEEGRKPSEVAESLNIMPKTLRGWVDKYKEAQEAGFIGSGNLKPEAQAVKDLEKKIKDLEEENEILKKAMHIFTKNPK